ncbi:hypothetical protein B0H19DRAFT_1193348 [Mycena capillaripes]|nr:hypothetical protein B0H19DRAFT_1193348 [Mycena capillaripes]
MHRALEILEMVEMICGEVHRTPSSHSTLCSLARVCRLFSKAALDFLWKHQFMMANILACMPTDLWEVVGSGRSRFVRARRAIRPEDWVRFQIYAHRVRVLIMSDHFCDSTTDTWSPVFEMLGTSLPMEHLFPNLHTLIWRVNRQPWFSHVDLLLCPRIDSLSLGTVCLLTHLALLLTLPTRCPLVTSVKVRTGPELHAQWPLLSTMVCKLTRLAELDVANVDQHAFEHLSQLSTLRSLTIQHEPEFAPPQRKPDVHFFTRLRGLTLEDVSHNFLEAFISMDDAWCFVNVTAYITSTPTAAETARLYAGFATKCDPSTLECLTLDGTSGVHVLDHSAGLVVPFDALRPLLPFHALRDVSLLPPAGFSLDDASLESLAHAWPRICSLHLPGSGYRAPPSRVTLGGLRTLARLCRELTFLEISFDASVVPDTNDVLPEAEQGCLLWLDVDDAVLVDPVPVAAYLFAVFPKLEGIEVARQDEVGEDVWEHAARLHELWRQVERLHPTASAAMTTPI